MIDLLYKEILEAQENDACPVVYSPSQDIKRKNFKEYFYKGEAKIDVVRTTCNNRALRGPMKHLMFESVVRGAAQSRDTCLSSWGVIGT